MFAVGLMCGTSLDGIDAALVSLRPRGAGYAIELQRFSTEPFSDELRERLVRALPPHEPSPGEIAALEMEVGTAFGAAAAGVAASAPVDFVASHGVTLFHDGAARRTFQIGDPYAIRERTRATVVFDFRRADCAAGGQGAPLVPYADALLLGSAERTAIALNIGGIANLTLLPRGAALESVRAWDTGPGNIVLDAFVAARTRERCDRGGARAARGTVSPAALDELLRDPYFAALPPKTTGRERFGPAFLAEHAAALAELSIDDGCATLAALTVETIAAEIERADAEAGVFVSGGGVHNTHLMRRLSERLGPRRRVASSQAAGIDPDAKEALAFAVLGYEALRGRPAGLPRVTGARSAAVLGAIAPHGLRELLVKMDAELAANHGA
jgi:anhydro-N-acetylmuramic acid kinase